MVDSSEAEAEIKKTMINNSESSVFLCDHNKLGKLGVPSIVGLDKIDYFITDVELDEDWTDALNKYDVNMIKV